MGAKRNDSRSRDAGTGRRDRRQPRPDGRQQRRLRRPVRLVQPVVERTDEELLRAGGERGAEHGSPPGREGRVHMWDLHRERGAGGFGRHGRLGNDGERHSGEGVGHPRNPSAPREADAAGEGGREVVPVPLERETRREELLRVGLAPGGERSRDEPERDHGRARAEPALARDPVRECERAAIGGCDPSERADAEVTLVGLLVSLTDLDLVPEIERHRGAVEGRAEVGGCRRSADPNRHAAASAIASASGSTSTGGSAWRSTASGSLSPCPVTTQTTRSPRGDSFSTAASPAADDGSQKTPSSRARSSHAATISVSASGTTAPPDSATAASASVRCTGSGMRIAVAKVSARTAASPARRRGLPRPASAKPLAYAQVFPPPP